MVGLEVKEMKEEKKRRRQNTNFDFQQTPKWRKFLFAARFLFAFFMPQRSLQMEDLARHNLIVSILWWKRTEK